MTRRREAFREHATAGEALGSPVDGEARDLVGRCRLFCMPRLDDQHVRLRSEVVRLRSSARRRVCNVTVHVGVVGRPSDSFVVGESALPAMDASLRADVVSELLQRSGDDSDMLWIWRPGTPHLHDLDLEWTSAAGLAFGAHARVLRACYAITWTGWLDIRSGESRIWKRLRV